MKKSVKIIGLCEACHTRKATQLHEKFPDTQSNRKLYGELLYDRRNTQIVCAYCNASHAGHGKGLITWNELEFCDALGIEPLSKTGRLKMMTGAI